MHVCKYLHQRERRIGEYDGKPFPGVSKTKKKKASPWELMDPRTKNDFYASLKGF